MCGAGLRLYTGVLQAHTAVFEMQYLVRSTANRDAGSVNDAIAMFDTACCIARYESNQVAHGITSR